MFSPEFENTREAIEMFAKKNRHEFVTVEHLLLGLLDDADAQAVLLACQVDMDTLRDELMRYIDAYVPKSGHDRTPATTKAFLRVLQRAIWQIQTSGQNTPITGIDVLVSIFKEKDSHAVSLLKTQGLSGVAVMRYVSHGGEKSDDQEDD